MLGISYTYTICVRGAFKFLQTANQCWLYRFQCVNLYSNKSESIDQIHFNCEKKKDECSKMLKFNKFLIIIYVI